MAARFRLPGCIAVTDPGWHRRLLAGQPGPKDANFWRPSTQAVRLAEGTPFFFKLRAPQHFIAGFGFFAGFTVLPDWLAWETFGQANGVGNLAELRARLGGIQKGARITADSEGRIGCCLIAECVFFPEELWVKPPADWKPRTQVRAGYELAEGEGQRIWLECLERRKDLERDARAEAPRPTDGDVLQEPPALRVADPPTPERYGTGRMHAPRLGQGIFRVRVLDAYGRACAVTREHSLPVLDAAHIRPYAEGGQHAVANGLSLRSDLHRLFDRGYVTVDEDSRFAVSERLRQDFDNGRSYYQLAGREIELPVESAWRPDPAALKWHRENVYRG